MVQLPHRRFLLVFVPQVHAVLLVQTRQRVVLHRMHRDDARPRTIMERRALQEFVDDLRALRPGKIDLHEFVTRLIRRALLVGTPTRVGEAQVAAAAITRDPPRALLLGRAMRIVNANEALAACLHEGQSVHTVHQLPRHLDCELHMGLFVFPARDVHLQAARLAPGVFLEKRPYIRLKLTVGDIRMQITHPQSVGAGHAHDAWPIRWHMRHLALALRAPTWQAQGPLQLGTRNAGPHAVSGRAEANNVLWQDLLGLRNHIVLLARHPNMVAIRIGHRGRLVPKTQPTHEHVEAASTIPPGDIRVLRKVLAGTEDLASSAASIEACLRDRQDIRRMRSMEALQLVGFPAQRSPELTAALVVVIGQEGVVHDPGLLHVARCTTLRPKCLHGRQLASSARRDAYTGGRRSLLTLLGLLLPQLPLLFSTIRTGRNPCTAAGQALPTPRALATMACAAVHLACTSAGKAGLFVVPADTRPIARSARRHEAARASTPRALPLALA